ncbi:Hypothetical predicted protein [Cloeon dipterum]|uniref:UBC core domain-containing protein n=1 Tax=Cloeon dipterum TaxID=197152 RepID=A0A8S1CZU2_9INSE|nr:Hypothetical predicted protein [Cloeon dipterum]
MDGKYNAKSPAVKRIMREACELQAATDHYWARPLEDNLFEWHFTVRGPSGTDFEGGLYHGRILLPPEYPMKPPNIILLTPSGRFEVNKKICLSISGHHPETWQPSWSIRTALLALVAFMPTDGQGTIGALDYTPEERQVLAKRSANWSCDQCGHIAGHLASSDEEAAPLSTEESELVGQITFKEEDNAAAAAATASQNNSPVSEAAEVVAEAQPDGSVAGSQAVILGLLVAIALLLYRRMFLLE